MSSSVSLARQSEDGDDRAVADDASPPLTHSDDESSLAYSALVQFRRESSVEPRLSARSNTSRTSVERRQFIEANIKDLMQDMIHAFRGIPEINNTKVSNANNNVNNNKSQPPPSPASPEAGPACFADLFSPLDLGSDQDDDDSDHDHGEDGSVDDGDQGGGVSGARKKRKHHRPVAHKPRRKLEDRTDEAAASRIRIVAAEVERQADSSQRLMYKHGMAESRRQQMRKEWEDERRGFGDRVESWMAKIVLVAHLKNSQWHSQLRYLRARSVLRNQFIPPALLKISRSRRARFLAAALSGRLSPVAADSTFPPFRAQQPSLLLPSVDSLMMASPIIAHWPRDVVEQLVREMQPIAMLRGDKPLLRREDPTRCSTAFFFLSRGSILVGDNLVLRASSQQGRDECSTSGAHTASSIAMASASALAASSSSPPLSSSSSSSSADSSSLCVLRTGEYYGDVAVVCGDPFGAPIRCTTECILFCISGARFMQLMQSFAGSVPRSLRSSIAACKLLLRLQLTTTAATAVAASSLSNGLPKQHFARNDKIIQVEELKDADPVFASMPNGAVQQMILKAFPVVLFNGEVLCRDAHCSPCVYFVVMGRLTCKLQHNSAAEHKFFTSMVAAAQQATMGYENQQAQRQQLLQHKQHILKKTFLEQLKRVPMLDFVPGSVVCMSSFCRCQLFDQKPDEQPPQRPAEANDDYYNSTIHKAFQQQQQFYGIFDPSTRHTLTARCLTVVWAFPISEMNKVLSGEFSERVEPRIVETASNLVFDRVMERAGPLLHAVPAFGVERGLLRPKHMFQLRELFHPIVAVAGTILSKGGADAESVFVVVEGQVAWQRRRYYEQVDETSGKRSNVFEPIDLGRGGPGTVISLAEALVAKPCSLWCTCENSVVLLRATTADIRRAFENFPEETAWAVVWNVMTDAERAATRARQKELERRRLVTMSVLPAETTTTTATTTATATSTASTGGDDASGGEGGGEAFFAPPGAGVDVKAARALCRDRITRELQVAVEEQRCRDQLKNNRPPSPYSQWLANALESRRVDLRRLAIEQRVITSISSRVFGEQMSAQDRYILKYFDPESEENLRSFSANMFASDEAKAEAIHLALEASRLMAAAANNKNNNNTTKKKTKELASKKQLLQPATEGRLNLKQHIGRKRLGSPTVGGVREQPLPVVHIRDCLEPAKKAADSAAIERKRLREAQVNEKTEDRQAEEQQQQHLRKSVHLASSFPVSSFSALNAAAASAARSQKVLQASKRSEEAMNKEVDAKVQEVLLRKRREAGATSATSSVNPSGPRPQQQQQHQQQQRRVVVHPLPDNIAGGTVDAVASSPPTRDESDLSIAQSQPEQRHVDGLLPATKSALLERRLNRRSRQQFAQAETFSRIRREADVPLDRVAPEELNSMAMDFLIKNCPALSRKQQKEEESTNSKSNNNTSSNAKNKSATSRPAIPQPPPPPPSSATARNNVIITSSQHHKKSQVLPQALSARAPLPALPKFATATTTAGMVQLSAIRREEKTKTDLLLAALLHPGARLK